MRTENQIIKDIRKIERQIDELEVQSGFGTSQDRRYAQEQIENLTNVLNGYLFEWYENFKH